MVKWYQDKRVPQGKNYIVELHVIDRGYYKWRVKGVNGKIILSCCGCYRNKAQCRNVALKFANKLGLKFKEII